MINESGTGIGWLIFLRKSFSSEFSKNQGPGYSCGIASYPESSATARLHPNNQFEWGRINPLGFFFHPILSSKQKLLRIDVNCYFFVVGVPLSQLTCWFSGGLNYVFQNQE
jgi:hypothetical protein